MQGRHGHMSSGSICEGDLAFALQHEIEILLSVFDDDPRCISNLHGDALLKALYGYILGKFDIDAIDHMASHYESTLWRIRQVENDD